MIRIYGHAIGQHSFTQVSRGLCIAAKAKGCFGGFVPVDGAYDDDEVYGGGQARVGLVAGAPGGIRWAHSIGQHEARWILIAPNSSVIPPETARRVKELATGVLSPSEWGVAVLRRLLHPLPVALCQHGVFPEYRPEPMARERAAFEYTEGRFDVLHLTSTASDRKGTRPLLRAWQSLRAHGELPPRAKLHLVAMHQCLFDLWQMVKEHSLRQEVELFDSGMGLGPAKMAAIYSAAHVVCQPSRAEGFGLVPLESLACAVPVVATFCTGHADYLPALEGGAARVPDYPETDISGEGAGARAPTVEPESIAQGLRYGYEHWERLQADATRLAPRLAAEWSWEARSGPTLAALARGTPLG